MAAAPPVTWVTDRQMELMLEYNNVGYTLVKGLPVAAVDAEAGRHNRARIGQAIDDERVLSMAAAGREVGLVLGPLVLRPKRFDAAPPPGHPLYDPMDGNHRLAALLLLAVPHVWAYVISDQVNDDLADIVTRQCNIYVGKGLTTAEKIEHAAFGCRQLARAAGVDYPDRPMFTYMATRFHVPADRIAARVRLTDFQVRLGDQVDAAYTPGWTRLSEDVLYTILQVGDDDAAVVLVRGLAAMAAVPDDKVVAEAVGHVRRAGKTSALKVAEANNQIAGLNSREDSLFGTSSRRGRRDPATCVIRDLGRLTKTLTRHMPAGRPAAAVLTTRADVDKFVALAAGLRVALEQRETELKRPTT